MSTSIPNVVSIAGVDPSGGAGIFADIKTFSALGAYGCGVVAVPTVVFYDDVDAGAPLVRFTFCKRRDVLEDAVTRLQGLAR